MFAIKKSPNVAKLQNVLKHLDRDQKQAIRKTFYDVGKLLVAEAKAEIDKTPKHGRVYTRYYGTKGKLARGRKYTASAPGEAPAKVTGALYDSIDFTVNGIYSMEFGVDQARHGVFYGPALEYKNPVSMTGWGSPHIAPRPFISAAYSKNKDAIRQKFVLAIAQILKR